MKIENYLTPDDTTVYLVTNGPKKQNPESLLLSG